MSHVILMIWYSTILLLLCGMNVGYKLHNVLPKDVGQFERSKVSSLKRADRQ